MTFEEILEQNCQLLGWRDTTNAYYGLDFTPFMNIIEESVQEYAVMLCRKQREICADNAQADYNIINTSERATLFREDNIEVYVLKQSILQCKNAIDL